MPGTATLAAFSRDWIGGDIGGLQEVAEELYSYLPHVQDLAGRLSGDSFADVRCRQAATVRAFEKYVGTAARTIESLAVELSQIESALENEAYLVAMDGVHIGENGTVVGYAGPHGLRTAFEYRKVFQQAQDEADQARRTAAEQLCGLYRQAFDIDVPAAKRMVPAI